MKPFTIIYDKEQKEYATILHTLVSEIEETKNIKQEFKIYEQNMNLTDKDYALFIGDKSSLMYRENFKDNYSKYGIHLGYRGTKAWIYCEKAKWDKKTYNDFHNELLELYKKMSMNPSKAQKYVDEGVKEYIKTGTSAVPVGSTIAQQVLWSSIITSQIIVMSPVSSLIYMIYRWIKSLFAESTRIDQQYRFATVLFFSEYLKEYLKIITNESNE